MFVSGKPDRNLFPRRDPIGVLEHHDVLHLKFQDEVDSASALALALQLRAPGDRSRYELAPQSYTSRWNKLPTNNSR